MGSSKTANALMVKFNYEEKNHTVLLIKPAIDNRDDYLDENGNVATVVKSRIGLEAKALTVATETNLIYFFEKLIKTVNYNVIICDECQFLTEKQVDELKEIAESFDVPVLCFGLRSDFQTKLFPGSKRLFEIADNIAEIKSICKCGRKAIVNARFDRNGKVVTTGEQVDIGGNEKYEGMCWYCWKKITDEENQKL
jgi:thymidine kinase